MRRFGRQCQGQGQVGVKLVRYTEQQLLIMRVPIQAQAQQAQEVLAQATALRSSTRERLASALPKEPSAHSPIHTQSTRLV
jgi:hypothetical protein